MFRFLLFPFSIIYFFITSVRNFLYDKKVGYYKPQIFDAFTISVGNLAIGGTGKTPHIEYLVRFLYDKYKVATLSRGYGRKTNGIIIAERDTSASEIGDEPMQYFKKFYPKIHVAVGEERIVAIPHILSHYPETQVVLLDDCFQHRKVKPHINILLTDYSHLFFKDYLLPFGRLRESRKGAKRADMVIVTKCPEELDYKKEYIKIKLKKYLRNPKIPVFFTSVKYGTPLPVFDNGYVFNHNHKVVLVSGIARHEPLEKYVAANLGLKKHLVFNDHHQYLVSDYEKILLEYKAVSDETLCVLTTEKDMVKWQEQGSQSPLSGVPVFYLPIEIYFLENETVFQQYILRRLK